jgi:hypothetical protein
MYPGMEGKERERKGDRKRQRGREGKMEKANFFCLIL